MLASLYAFSDVADPEVLDFSNERAGTEAKTYSAQAISEEIIAQGGFEVLLETLDTNPVVRVTLMDVFSGVTSETASEMVKNLLHEKRLRSDLAARRESIMGTLRQATHQNKELARIILSEWDTDDLVKHAKKDSYITLSYLFDLLESAPEDVTQAQKDSIVQAAMEALYSPTPILRSTAFEELATGDADSSDFPFL